MHIMALRITFIVYLGDVPYKYREICPCLGLWHGIEGKGVLGVTHMELQVLLIEIWERTNNVNTHYYNHAVA